MFTDSLDFLDPADAEAVKRMLGAVIDRPDLHQNHLRGRRHRDGSFTVHLASRGNRSAINNPTPFTGIVTTPLSGNGWIVPHEDAQDGTYKFTQEAIGWFRENRYSDGKVREFIGREATAKYHEGRALFALDLTPITERMGISPERLQAQKRLLIDIGMFGETGRSQTTEGLISFTQDGLLWATQGYPVSLARNNVAVEVTVHINIQAFIQQVRQLDIPAEEKYEAEDLAREIEREPSIENVSRMMGMAANAQALLPSVLDFFSRNGHAILQGFQNIGHM